MGFSGLTIFFKDITEKLIRKIREKKIDTYAANELCLCLVNFASEELILLLHHMYTMLFFLSKERIFLIV